MRRFGGIISLVAVLGMLVHAGLLVRHNGMMLDAAFDRIALIFAGQIICHDADGTTKLSENLPHHPSGKMPNCPVCMGALAGAAILPPMIAFPAIAMPRARPMAIAAQRLAMGTRGIRPPTRAPPETIPHA